MKMLEGRNFEPTDSINYDHLRSVGNAVITESLAKLMGKGNRIGQNIV